MEVRKKREDASLVVSLEGRLDTMTAPQLERSLEDEMEGLSKLIFDLEGIEYISSAGLRVILNAQKKMNRQGEMIVRHVNEEVMEVLELTGLVDVLTIE